MWYNMIVNAIEWRLHMNFQEKLLYVRAKLNLSQTELAKELGVSFSTINRWETGKVIPTRKAVLAFEIYCESKKIFFCGEK